MICIIKKSKEKMSLYMQEEKELTLEKHISSLLVILKIGPNLKGYDYLKAGALEMTLDHSKKHHMSNNLYAKLSTKFNLQRDCIDRAMRHAIDISHQRGGIPEFEKLADVEFSLPRPTPREMMCMLSILAEQYDFSESNVAK